LAASTTASVDEAAAARVVALDGLRGLAAVVVVSCHLFEFSSLSHGTRSLILSSPVGVLFNGPGAVHLFFVLSGYVLALSLSRDAERGRLLRFYPRRILRIHPPYVAAVLLAWVASFGYPLLGSPAGRQSGFCIHMPADLLPRALALPSLAFGQLPIGWSLYVELMMSMLFPLLLALGRHLHPLAPVLLGAILVQALHPRWNFLVFTLDFAIGVTLHLERERIARWFGGLSGPAWAGLGLASLMLLEAPYPFAWWWYRSAILPGGHSPGVVASMSLGAAGLLVAALHQPAFHRALTTPLARWFGRISYSLYLVHFTVLLFLVCRITGPGIPPLAALALFPVVLAVSAALAEVGYRLVEAPSMRAGRALGRALGGKRPVAPRE
jgi:peptidoglycan/LPS O-acetylase OafA/YrhL